MQLAEHFGDLEEHATDQFSVDEEASYITVIDSEAGHRADMWHADETFLEEPPLVRGGLLCEEMGLGKTAEITALVLAGRDGGGGGSGAPLAPVPPKSSGLYRGDRATLVVAPDSLVSQWQAEVLKAAPGCGVLLHINHNPPRHAQQGPP